MKYIFCLIGWFVSLTQVYAVKEIIIGEKTFTEQYILGNLVSVLLQEEGFKVKIKPNMRTDIIRMELVKGTICCYWEYTGTAAVHLFKLTDPKTLNNANKLYEEVKRLDLKNGIHWLDKTSISNTWVLLTRTDFSQTQRISTISDLAHLLNQEKKIKIGMLQTFYERNDGFQGLATLYGFTPKLEQVLFGGGREVIGKLVRKEIDFAVGFGTYSGIKEYNLTILKDERSYFPAYNPVFTVRNDILQKKPQIAEVVNKLVKHLDQKTMIELNHKVDFKGFPITDVVNNFLRDKGLL